MTGNRPFLRRVGDRSLLLEFASLDQVHRAWRTLRADPPGDVADVVAGSRTVLLVLRSAAERAQAERRLRDDRSSAPAAGSGRVITIPVSYDGPDLADVAALTGLDESEVVRIHAGGSYTVSFVGFSPGFAYLVGVDPALHVPRRATPRLSVPAGAVALAAGMTAVYPQATPGGWRLIGRSATRMFDPSRSEPSLLMPGDRVRFRPVDRLEPPAGPDTLSAGMSWARGCPYVEVVAAGIFTTVQDTGRTGWAHLGVPGAGVADRSAAGRANRLAGNSPGAAVLETTMSGLRIRIGAPRRVAVTGALVDLTVDGMPARAESALSLPAGSELSVDSCRAGLRSYVAVEGGIDVSPVLGSRSTDTLSGLGPRPVRAGDRLPLGPPTGAGRGAAAVRVEERSPADARRHGFRTGPPREGELVTLTASRGPRHDWVGPVGMRTLAGAEYRIGPSSDRTGVRLSGPSVPVGRPGQLPSEGMVAGAVEIPPDGQPIVLLRNHPSTGGYPVAAVVDDTGLDLLAQCRPGVRVRFHIV